MSPDNKFVKMLMYGNKFKNYYSIKFSEVDTTEVLILSLLFKYSVNGSESKKALFL